jgi:hypothetical protein
MILTLAQLLLPALLAANHQTTAFSATSPVDVTSYSFSPSFTTTTYDNVPYSEQDGTTFRVAFKNVATQPIKSVDFAISDGGTSMAVVQDVGNFSPNVTIDHSFVSPITDPSGVTVTIQSVTFADGSTWNAPGALASAATAP